MGAAGYAQPPLGADVGTQTCGGYPGSLNHFKQDAQVRHAYAVAYLCMWLCVQLSVCAQPAHAPPCTLTRARARRWLNMQTFADWGIDSLKLDGCNVDVADMSTLYPEMGAALNATGRPILYSCSWPAYLVGSKTIPTNYTLIGIYCNLWRNYDDIQVSSRLLATVTVVPRPHRLDHWQDSASSMLGILDWWQTNQKVLVPAAGPGAKCGCVSSTHEAVSDGNERGMGVCVQGVGTIRTNSLWATSACH